MSDRWIKFFTILLLILLPAISCKVVVWKDKRNGNDDIYGTRTPRKEP